MLQNIVDDSIQYSDQLQQTEQTNQKNELYKLVSYQKQRKWGGALAFNHDGTLLSAASKNDVKVWQFKNGILSEPVFLKGDKLIRIIKFANLSNFFITGGSTNQILFWNQNKGQWSLEQKLDQHQNRVSCFIIKKDDSQIISSSEDGTIKFWQRNDDGIWECVTTLTSIYGAIYSVIINQSENLIVSSSANKILTIWKYGSSSLLNRSNRQVNNINQKWKKYQNIKNDDYGTKICFIGDDQLTWQPTNTGLLYIFQINFENELFELKNKIQLGEGNYDFHYFQSIYNSSQKLLIVRHKYKIYFLNQLEKSEFSVQQVISYSTNWNFCALSPDGKYFVSWDFKNLEYQIMLRR